MTWLAPGALLGLGALALPILVHWLARHQADRRPFPTLRFLPITPPASVRRHRISDARLLVVRCAIIAAAAAALAQPALYTAPPPAARPPRAIVVDISASLRRTLPGSITTGEAAAEDAVTAAVADTDRVVVIRQSDVRRGLAQAGAWLREQPGAGEVVVISDFQIGAVTEEDFDPLPASAGRLCVRVGVTGPVPAPPGSGIVTVYGAPTAEAAARAVVSPVPGVATGQTSPAPTIAVVFEGVPEYSRLIAEGRPLDSPASYALADRIAGTMAVEMRATDRFDVVLLSKARPDSIDAATLIARALDVAAAPAVPLAEREPDTVDESTVEQWRRDPRPDVASTTAAPRPLTRWLWLVVLGLLLLETWVRRERGHAPTTQPDVEATHA